MKPPFRTVAGLDSVARALRPLMPAATAASDGSVLRGRCCEGSDAPPGPTAVGRSRLSDLDPHLHCSVIGTCLSTGELRKLLARFVVVDGLSDLDVHHEAVHQAALGGPVVRALNKALDRRHAVAMEAAARFKDTGSVEGYWDESLRQGAVPGAYWAVLTSRYATQALRKRAFGDVHMLSHLVGAANRADIRRLAALEQENVELRDLLDQQRTRLDAMAAERQAWVSRLEGQTVELEQLRRRLGELAEAASVPAASEARIQALSRQLALQTERRESAECAAAAATDRADRVEKEMAREREHAHQVLAELQAVENEMRNWPGPRSGAGPGPGPDDAGTGRLRGRRILYIGGRPSSGQAIRDLVLRQGGEFNRHDGGLEDRKGLLESAVAWADLVLFPVDCIDHDSVARLKRACAQKGRPFKALRTASIASFAAAISDVAGADTR